MIIRNFILLLLLLFPLKGMSQTYGNEWINYNQSYYSFKIVNDGVYRLDYSTLIGAGIPLTTFQTENIQLFARETEIPIHIEDGGDSSFDPGDYLIFYGERNDGWLDATLYETSGTQGDPYYSLYNDTIEYFFTWNSSTSNLRYQIETDTNFASFPNTAQYIGSSIVTSFSQDYFDGVVDQGATSSFYKPGEGWGKPHNNGAGGGYTYNGVIPTPLPYLGGGVDAIFSASSVSNSNAAFTGQGNHHTRWEFGSGSTVFMDTVYTGYNQIKCNVYFNPNLLTNGNTPLKWMIIDDQGALTDYQSLSYFTLTYPRLPDFQGSNNIEFDIYNDGTQSKVRLDISNAGFNNPLMLVNGIEPKIVPFVANGGFHSALIPNSSDGSSQHVIYKDSSTIININSVTPVNGTGVFTDFLNDLGSIEAALLFITHPILQSASSAYETYRESSAGGNYNVISADINELYQQFGGGIEKHIYGIRRFAHYIYNNSTQKPVGLFLIGKGIREANYNSSLNDGPGSRKNVNRFHNNLIPSFGQPSSDILITANLNGTSKWVPLIPTGRISARTNAELDGYLNKVIEYELQQDPTSVYNTPNKDWQKHVLHFGGGSDASQQAQFQGYLEGYEYFIEDSLFGGHVNRIYKTSSNPLDPTILDGITSRIEDGVSLMTYFGHASATSSGFEINLDEPGNWNNTGKYPLILANSCYNGNIFQQNVSKSEEFVQIANYGAIGYIASVSVGWDVYLNSYSLNLYKQMSPQNYGATIAEQMRMVVSIMETPANNIKLESNTTQMVLNGDPMVRLNWHQNPEIEILPEKVWFTPNDLNLTVDSIEMFIEIANLGHSVTDTISLEITRSFPGSNDDSLYTFQLPNLHYRDTFSFKMPLQANIGIGINNFTIRVDLPSEITEQYDELNNNQIVKTLYIDIDGIVPVIPYDFAVVPFDTVTVKGSTINPIADFNNYRFEIDTTDLFNSPEHRFANVSGFGGVKEVRWTDWFNVNTGMKDTLWCGDSVVYFWRCAVDSSVYDWRESSFQYITGKEGWGQDHFFQFKKNGFFSVDYDRPSRSRQFGPFTRQLTCDALATTASPGYYYNAWYIDGNLQDYGILNYIHKLHVAVIDPITLEAWGTRYVPTNENMGNNFGNNNDNCCGRSWKFFTFNQNDPVRLDAFQDMVLNQVPDGHYILIYSPMQTRYDLWNSLDSVDMYNTFAALGSDSIHGGRINSPMAFFCQKGDTNSVVELFAPTLSDDVHLEADLIGNDFEGGERSTLIGPAAQWNNVYWKQDPSEVGSADSTVLSISAYDISGTFQFKIDTAFTANDSILNLNSLIDAIQYPFIDLSAYYNDTVTNTPAQIDRWHVLYQPLPEAAIDGTNLYTWSQPSDTLEEGQTVDFAVDIKNIFTIDMDSLLVSYWIEDVNQVKIPIPYSRQDSLRVNEVLRDTVTFSTAGLAGINSLWVEVNPYVNGSLYITDQPEQEHFNNLLQIPFYVVGNDVNPILDVTFNGNHILNGDIVDPNSEILITLKDDNPYMIMDDVSDTTLFGVYLTDPYGVQKRVPFVNGVGETVMQWIPADASNLRFKIIWPSELTADGTYTLFVQGADRSGNLSADLEYKVQFEVIHESTITHMMNYPNPFSTSTRFVFTLTGSEAPDDIIIQIMTVSGKVVREITEDELGPIQIGRNITEYAWDGTDEFGDPLANGVYLYRVRAKLNGEMIKHRESGADPHFTKDFGKMYLMR